MVRNLSNREYLRAASDLIGRPLDGNLIKGWTATSNLGGFDAILWNNLDAKSARDRSETVEAIVDSALGSGKLMTCAVKTAADTKYEKCAQSILEGFAKRAYGRPLTMAETTALRSVYSATLALATGVQAKPEDAFRDSVRTALGSILLAPQFMTRIEAAPAGPNATERELSSYELASRLSFMFTGSLPDNDLWARAEDGSLSNPNVLAEQASRLLSTKTSSLVEVFLGQWFDFRAYESAKLGSLEYSMWRESVQTLTDVIRQDMPPSALLRPGFTYVNSQLSSHYGMAASPSPNFVRVATPDRGGILQQGSWLTLSSKASATHPMHRGRLVQERLLCKPIAAASAELFEQIKATSAKIPATATVKERLEKHREQPLCKGCHEYMDPIGLGLESYDEKGRWRSAYPNGARVDTQSTIVGKPFGNAQELTSEILAMPEYTRCVAEKIAVYGLRTATPDPALLDDLTRAQDNQAPGLRTMLLRFVNSTSFRKVALEQTK
jgi:hypothetical protein